MQQLIIEIKEKNEEQIEKLEEKIDNIQLEHIKIIESLKNSFQFQMKKHEEEIEKLNKKVDDMKTKETNESEMKSLERRSDDKIEVIEEKMGDMEVQTKNKIKNFQITTKREIEELSKTVHQLETQVPNLTQQKKRIKSHERGN